MRTCQNALLFNPFGVVAIKPSVPWVSKTRPTVIHIGLLTESSPIDNEASTEKLVMRNMNVSTSRTRTPRGRCAGRRTDPRILCGSI